MKIEKFELNKKYVFSAEEYYKRKGFNTEWAYKFDGTPVKVIADVYATMGKREYGIVPAWCKEITK